MKFIRCKSMRGMIFVDIDHKIFIDHLVETSDSCIKHGITKDNYVIKEETELEGNKLCLDPGGMYCKHDPHEKFEFRGFTFDIQLTKIGFVLGEMNQGKERMPGVMRFPLWYNFVVISTDLFALVEEKLKELEQTPEAMNAELDEFERLSDLEKSTKGVFRMNIPREGKRIRRKKEEDDPPYGF